MYLGIDFGTCYSSAALLLEGVPTPIPAPLTPGYALPSSVFITEQGEILVGQAAENKRQKNPQRYRREFKRDLGSPDPYTFGKTFMLPEELVTEVLKKLKGEAEKVSQARGEKSLTDVLITVPATYSSYKRNLMQEAAKKAGFRKIELLEEPVAAAIYYSRHAQINDGDIILVYDLGGGTFDATLMQRQEDKYQFLGMPKGLANCGGKDCDCLIYQHLKSNCSENLSQQLESKDAWRVKAMVGDYCRDLKHQLSEQLKASVYIPLGGGDLESFELTRDIFNKMISPLIEETLDCCDQLVRSAGLNWEKINQVLLVGGSSRIPYVKDAIKQKFRVMPLLVDTPELAVCLGAAMYKQNSLPITAYAIGIDLGTTNSVVSLFRRGKVETLTVEGRSTMPSVVSFRPDQTVLVGQAAKARLLIDPENTISSVKRFMGNHHQTYRLGGKSFTPIEISSLLLKHLVENVKKTLKIEVHDAVITVPAYFTESQREDTKKAGEQAGLNVLRLENEPTAAAIAYGLDREKKQRLMVYDLGGGTFDVSILEVQNNRFTVKAVGGDTHLGGDDFDESIVSWASQKFQNQTGIDLMNDQSFTGKIARQRLKEAAENAKIELSQANTAALVLPDCCGYPLELELSLSEYNQLIAPFLQRTVDCMRSVLGDAQLTPEDIDRVILVGGSTKNRAVREIVAREIKEPYVSERVDEVVSHGAAIVAANLLLPDTVDIEITNVTGHSLGIDMRDPEKNELFFNPIIPRQTTYPCRRGRLGYTVYPRQELVNMRVFRGENYYPDKNTLLGEISLPISPPKSEEVPVGAIFELDADGIIHFTAVHLPLGQDSEAIIQYAREHEGMLDLIRVDQLINCGKAQTDQVKIKSGL